jgi:hypothetical protein
MRDGAPLAGPYCQAGGSRQALAALVHPEIGVLGCDDQFLHAYSQVGLMLSAVHLSRSWEEGLWHAS